MKYNKYLLIVLSVLILFIFVSSASASNVNETDSLSIDKSNNLENNILSVDNNVKSNELDNNTLKVSDDEILTAGNDWYVDSSKSKSGDGKSPEKAFKTLKEAVTSASDDDKINIASGKYEGSSNTGLTIDKNYPRNRKDEIYNNKSPYPVKGYSDDENMWQKIKFK